MEVLERLCVLCLLLLKLSHLTKVLAAVVPVCPGGQLNLTCSTDEMVLSWTITFPHSPGSEERIVLTTGVIEPLTEGQTMFKFLRTSVSPLTSVMMIENINVVLNGTRVACSDPGGVISTDIIDVIGNGMTSPTPSIELTLVSQVFENNSVVVTLEWTVENGAFSSLSVVPQAEITNLGPSSRRLVISYNTSYNVTAVASLCEQHSSHSFELHYVKCASPLRLLTEELVIANYRYPATEGTIAMFSCSSSGYVLIRPSTATCTSNGEWVPDPRQVQCEAIDCGSPSVNINVNATYNSTSFNARLTLTCADGLLPSGVPTALCHSNGSWTPDPTDFTCNSAVSPDHKPERGNSSTVNQNLIVAAAVISSIIVAVVLFLLGCASGWFGHKYKDTIQARSDKTSNSKPAPLYEDLRPTSTSEDQDKAFELKENVAYGPVRAT